MTIIIRKKLKNTNSSICQKYFNLRLQVGCILIICVIGIMFFVVVNLLKKKILYHPDKKHYLNPSQILQNICHQNLMIKHHNVTVHSWLFKHHETAPTILVSHGNGGNLCYRGHLIRIIYSLGVNVCIYDYQGYGHSTGYPSEQNFYADGDAMVQYLTKHLHIPSDQIIFWGESIGCAVAAYLARKYQSRKLVLLSGFASVKEMFYHLISTYPSFLKIFGALFSEFPTHHYLTQYAGNVLLLHSRNDEIVPYHQAVINARLSHCKLLNIKGTHNSPIFSNQILGKIREFINKSPTK